ncbi:MAG: flavodoxin family protein [Clostridiales Family XIII bacterium]|jgi:multimeric flavodoxin WrbA|nr:flavodoxin family protein [Clostridiales Family XIII bacterium]
MKVLLINGSPHENGTTAAGLSEVAAAIEADGIETETLWIGKEPIRGCTACFACVKKPGRCVFDGDAVNEILGRAEGIDGLVIGSPVYWASPNGALLSTLDRVFYAGGALFYGKPGAAVAAARRAGTTATIDALYKYFPINGMPIVPAQYWPMVHGRKGEEAHKDIEGMQVMRLTGHTMAWMIKAFKAADDAGIPRPAPETPRAWTNFIR